MPVFTPISTQVELPREGNRCEGFTFDLKGAYTEDTKLPESAKDVAAFANHLGGNIIVGIPEVGGVAGPWSPLTADQATRCSDDYSRAMEFCQPKPVMTPERVAVAGGFIVVINVWPSPSQLIGVRHPEKRHYFRFPLRAGNQTTHIEPESMALYMDARLRRIIILLSGIPKGAGVAIMPRSSDASQAGGDYQGPLEVDEKANTFTARSFNQGHPPRVVCLDDVETVFLAKPSHWAVVVPVPK